MSRFLPRQADNAYHGSRLALWLFGVLVAMRLVMSLNSIFNARSVVTSADGIPLHTFTPAGARTAVSLFALLALSNLMIVLVCVLVLARYRALIPFMFTLLLLHHLSGRLVLKMMPIPRTGTPPGFVINLMLLALTLAGLALSLGRRGRAKRGTEA